MIEVTSNSNDLLKQLDTISKKAATALVDKLFEKYNIDQKSIRKVSAKDKEEMKDLVSNLKKQTQDILYKQEK